MSKPTTNYTRPAKPSTNSSPEFPGVTYGDNPLLDGSVPYGSGKHITNTARVSKSSTNTQGNAAYEATRTNYNAHVLYNAHIYYNGRDPNLIPGSTKTRTNSAKVSKASTNYAAA